MLKNAYFYEKSVKIASAFWGGPNSRWPPAAGGSAPRPPRCYSRLLLQLSREHWRF